MPWRLEEIIFGFLINKVLVGDLANFGLPIPHHPILRTHPIMNTQVLHYLGHGDLTCVPDVQELRGNCVRFVDGREEEIDLIVWATGYQRRFPFLDEPGGATKLDLSLELCHHTRPTLFFMGLFETDRQVFPISRIGTAAGCYVLDGSISRSNDGIRVIRDNIVVYDGKIASLKRFKEDVREVQAGYECGILIENFNDLKVGDILESYIIEKIATEL